MQDEFCLLLLGVFFSDPTTLTKFFNLSRKNNEKKREKKGKKNSIQETSIIEQDTFCCVLMIQLLKYFSEAANDFKISFQIFSGFMLPSHSSVASPICQEGQSERNFLIFAFSSRFFLIFFWFFLIFSRFFLIFSRVLAIFCCQWWHSAPPPCHPGGYAPAQPDQNLVWN